MLSGYIYRIPQVKKYQKLWTGFIYKVLNPDSLSSITLNLKFFKTWGSLVGGDDDIQVAYKSLDSVEASLLRNPIDFFEGIGTQLPTGLTHNDYALDITDTVRISVTLSGTNLENAEKNGFFIIRDQMDDKWSTISLHVENEVSSNYTDFVTDQSISPIDLNSTILDAHRDEFGGYSPYGQPKYFYSLSRVNGTDFVLENALVKYTNTNIVSIVDASGNRKNVDYNNQNFTIQNTFNGDTINTSVITVDNVGYFPTQVTTILPNNQEVTNTVQYSMIHQKPIRAINHFGVSVKYDYDNLGRIQTITAPNTFIDGQLLYSTTVEQTGVKLEQHEHENEYIHLGYSPGPKEPDLDHQMFASIYLLPMTLTSTTPMDYTYSLTSVKIGHDYNETQIRQGYEFVDAEYTWYWRTYLKLSRANISNFVAVDTVKVTFTVSKPAGMTSDLKVGIATDAFTPDSVILEGEFYYYDTNYSTLTTDSNGVYTYIITDSAALGKELLFSLTNTNDEEKWITVNSVKFTIIGQKLGDVDQSTVRYTYDDANNAVEYQKATDQLTGFIDGFYKLKSRYEFDDFSRFSRQIQYTDFAYDLNSARITETKYAYDNQVIQQTDVLGNFSRTYFDKYRSPIQVTNVKSDESDSTAVETDVSFLTRSDFLNLSYFSYDSTKLHFTGDNDFNYTRTETTDENGVISYTYTGPSGKKLATVADVGGKNQTVVYQYDQLGNLTKVIHPDSSETVYRYDLVYQTLRAKKLAAMTDSVRYAYDQFGRLRFSQDANQKADGEFLFFGYDKMGRQLYSGIYEETDANTVFNTLMTSSPTSLYATQAFETEARYLSKTQYDVEPSWSDSVWSQLPSKFQNYDFTYQLGAATLTAARSEINSTWTFSGAEIDFLGRTTRQFKADADGQPNIGTTEKTFEYDIINRVTKTSTTTTYGSVIKFSTYEWVDYDILGRVTNLYRNTIDRKPLEPISRFAYTRVDQVKSQTLGFGIQNIDFEYNFKGWLTKINQNSNMQFDEFGLSITYWENSSDDRNGNIKFIESNTPYFGLSGQSASWKYEFTYDNLNRLLQAQTKVGGTGNDHYKSLFGYDILGNFKTIERWGGNQ